MTPRIRRASHLAAVLSVLFLLAPEARAGGTPEPPSSARTGFRFTPRFDVRVRQEILPNVYWFDPTDDDRNWIRYRTRTGFLLQGRKKADACLWFRLANECRTRFEPSHEFDDDEIVVDQLAVGWPTGWGYFTIGRQEIAWNDGFLLFDGTPLDGSRTAYSDAIRVWRRAGIGRLDGALIVNEKSDPIVLASDDDRALRDADERAIAVRWFTPGDWPAEPSGAGWEAAIAGVGEKDPNGGRPASTGWTAAIRREAKTEGLRTSVAEIALQRRASGGEAGISLAGNAARARRLGEAASGEIGFFYYSGDGENTRAFRSLFGRWPKWSEMWVYSLAGEGGPAEWQNIASPYAALRIERLGQRPPLRLLGLRASVLVPYAPEPTWEDRGLLTKLDLQAALAPGWKAHLVWEWHISGSYPEGMTENAHFLRWQIGYQIPAGL